MTKIDYVISIYNKKNYQYEIRVRYKSGKDIYYNPKQLPLTVKRFIKNATHIGKSETSKTITETYYIEED